MPAPATISQTSLPSHSGPIVLIAARRPTSSRPTTLCSMPTPKSNPSSRKNPVHRTAMTMNQNGIRLPIVTSRPQYWTAGTGASASASDRGGGSSLRAYLSMSRKSTVPRVP